MILILWLAVKNILLNCRTEAVATGLALDLAQYDSGNHHDELKWNDGVLLMYSKKEAFRHIKNRYKNAVKPIAITMRKPEKEQWFQEMVRTLRSEGWLD